MSDGLRVEAGLTAVVIAVTDYRPRVLTVGAAVPGGAAWCDLYEFLPWEDRRLGDGEPWAPALAPWLAAVTGDARRVRRERVALAFGGGEAGWDLERCLERYELLFE